MNDSIVTMLTSHGWALPTATFACAGVLVFVIASRLTRHADSIACATGVGRLWIGSVLLAGSTSLPEIATDINAALLSRPNIGVGDLFGSTLANMLILAVLIVVYERRKMFQQAAVDHAMVGTLAIVLTAVAGLSIGSGGFENGLGVGYDTLAITSIYLVGMRMVFDLTLRTASVRDAEPPAYSPLPRRALRHALTGFAATTLGLMLAAPVLVISAEALAIVTGLTNTFVGTFLVGMTTSLPELSAAVAAMRMGAIDLAVANIFGSNAFNMIVLLMMDMAYQGKTLLSVVSHDHIVSACAAVAALALGVMAILVRTHKRPWATRSIALLIVATYSVSFYVMAGRG